jgi:hypothetical protein
MNRFEESLDAVPFSAVICRVAYRLVVYDYKYNPTRYRVPADGVCDLAIRLERGGFPALAMWCSAFAYKMTVEHLTVRQARDEVIFRATEAERRRRGGKPWTRVPKSCPRVTNRGAAFSARTSSASIGDGDLQ